MKSFRIGRAEKVRGIDEKLRCTPDKEDVS